MDNRGTAERIANPLVKVLGTTQYLQLVRDIARALDEKDPCVLRAEDKHDCGLCGLPIGGAEGCGWIHTVDGVRIDEPWKHYACWAFETMRLAYRLAKGLSGDKLDTMAADVKRALEFEPFC